MIEFQFLILLIKNADDIPLICYYYYYYLPHTSHWSQVGMYVYFCVVIVFKVMLAS